MTRVELASEVLDDLDRFLEHWLRHSVNVDAAERVEQILQGLAILEHSPLIGRPVEDGYRELVIGQRARGYVALYRYSPALDTAFVLAIRGQREQGFKR